MKNRIIAGVTYLIALPGIAGEWPVLTGMTTTILGAQHAVYTNMQWELREVGPMSETLSTSALNYIGAVHKHNGAGGAGASGASANTCGTLYTTPVGTSHGVTARSLYNKKWLPISCEHSGSPNGGECVGVVMKGMGNVSWGSIIFPPGTCTYAPPGNEWCSVVQPNITLAHGQLVIGTGLHTTSSLITTECTAPMSVKLHLGKDTVDLLNGMYSKLSIAGDVNGWHQMKLGSNTREITSTVNTDMAISAGPFSGSSVVFIEYY
ncbi:MULTISPECIES: hypothetical protein [unclassified Serratia (in: enterobacteria)]|uniref:hypothetical protein n=1 Tax=unclassified Serratia (in: enterobacteria) TaxID=2647522 RepID=UPI002ECFFAA6|nr:hypothetical protein [Serratia sp. C2(2)]MEE4449679.1 hypothetical protein [Serratia sp. C2(1)]